MRFQFSRYFSLRGLFNLGLFVFFHFSQSGIEPKTLYVVDDHLRSFTCSVSNQDFMVTDPSMTSSMLYTVVNFSVALLNQTNAKLYLRRTPPRSEALRHSGGDNLLWTSATVTLYLDVELSSESLPGTEQKTSLGNIISFESAFA